MNAGNGASRLRRELLVELAKLAAEGSLEEGVNKLPVALFPREKRSVRCCIYRDRAIVRYRLLAMLGFSVEAEADESTPLSDYAGQARMRAASRGTAVASSSKSSPEPFLTLIDEACNSCLRARYVVTELCQGCLARPCEQACPKAAIDVNGKATIDADKCVNCGLCMQACPYHAIAKARVPCEEACPVDAISKGESGKEEIDYDKCVYCGKCMSECPFGAIAERSQIVDVMARLAEARRGQEGAHEVVAIYAPAIATQFPSPPEVLKSALSLLGFADIYEAASGAEITADLEAAELAERMEGGSGLMTSSCCPAYRAVVVKHLPELSSRVSETRSPLFYAAQLARRDHPEASIIFIGPCVAKKLEALEIGTVDYVINAEELGAMLVANGIDLDTLTGSALKPGAGRAGRGFALSGGVTRAVEARLARLSEAPKPAFACLNGIDKKAVGQLRLYAAGKLKADFLEVMACEGGCISGPSVLANPKIAARQLEDLLKKSP